VLESSNQLEPRRSLLDDDLEDMDSESEEEEERQVCQESTSNNIKESQFW